MRPREVERTAMRLGFLQPLRSADRRCLLLSAKRLIRRFYVCPIQLDGAISSHRSRIAANSASESNPSFNQLRVFLPALRLCRPDDRGMQARDAESKT